MTVRMFVKFLLSVLTLFLLSSCGGGPVGFATSSTTTLDSDVARGTNPQTNVCSGYTVLPDSATVSVSLLPQQRSTTVIIDSVTITYTPANTSSPQLNPEHAVINQPIIVGTSGAAADVSFRVVSQEFKMTPPLTNLVCTNTIYSYYVTLTFSAHDINSGDTVNIDPARMNIRFADFVDTAT